jgi:signal transduction histidine kinase
MEKSISGWLGRSIAGALLLSSLVTFGALYAVGRFQVTAAFEQALLDDLRTIANVTLVYPNDNLYVDFQPEVLTQYLEGGSRFFQVWDAADHALLDQSPSLSSMNYLLSHQGQAPAEPRRFEATLPDGREVALVLQQIPANWGVEAQELARTGQRIRNRNVHLAVGRARSELTQALTPLMIGCAAGAIAMPLLAAVLLWLLVPRALRPLRELSEAVAHRDVDSDSTFAPTVVREMKPIVQCLNDLVTRIAEKRRRERRFLADTAHELRGPLAELHALADVAMLQAGEAGQHLDALQETKFVARRLSALIDVLFQIARHGRDSQPREWVALHEVVDEALPRLRLKGMTCHVDGDPGVQVHVPPVLLRALLDNLFGNVLAHGLPGSEVRVKWSSPGAWLSIRNLCKSAPDPEDEGQHLGSGLDIASLYAFALRAELQTGRTGSWFEVRLQFAAAS